MLVESQPLSLDTESLEPITVSFEAYFGSSAVAAFEKMDALDEPEEGGGGGGSHLSVGAVAGIVIGVSVFCILITVAIMFFVMKYKYRGHTHKEYPKEGSGSDSMRFHENPMPLSSKAVMWRSMHAVAEHACHMAGQLKMIRTLIPCGTATVHNMERCRLL
eukprot:gene21751-28773_t